MVMEFVLVGDKETEIMLYWVRRLIKFASDTWYGFGNLRGLYDSVHAYVTLPKVQHLISVRRMYGIDTWEFQ